jgi:hypothetical protein
MQTSQRAAGVAVGDIRLRDSRNQPVGAEFVGTERTREETAIVAVRFDVDNHHPCDINGREYHSSAPSSIDWP